MAVYRHAELDTYYEGPDSARVMLAQGGWERLSDEEADKYLADQRAAELGDEEGMASSVQYDPSVAGPESGAVIATSTGEHPLAAPDDGGDGTDEKGNG